MGGALPQQPPLDPTSLQAQDWFHGQIPRDEAEAILEEDGEFLVRESTTQAGQFVLTGMDAHVVKHLLLVDPEGVVSDWYCVKWTSDLRLMVYWVQKYPR